MAPIVSTSAITFRFEDEDFKILLEVALNNGKVISVSDSTQEDSAVARILKARHSK